MWIPKRVTVGPSEKKQVLFRMEWVQNGVQSWFVLQWVTDWEKAGLSKDNRGTLLNRHIINHGCLMDISNQWWCKHLLVRSNPNCKSCTCRNCVKITLWVLTCDKYEDKYHWCKLQHDDESLTWVEAKSFWFSENVSFLLIQRNNEDDVRSSWSSRKSLMSRPYVV